MRLFADAYGLEEAERAELVPMLARRALSMHYLLAREAGRGTQPWARLWAEGHGAVWRADAEYTERREAEWARVLLS
ncbi:hypothetical protein ABT095_29420 [Kitasatospora sp. NPDC002227]|uniref:hypothetical protein n=1 Tax=Kitasatospora sp. NPDC002227 TaxID=3154773 RepID=UPI003322D001